MAADLQMSFNISNGEDKRIGRGNVYISWNKLILSFLSYLDLLRQKKDLLSSPGDMNLTISAGHNVAFMIQRLGWPWSMLDSEEFQKVERQFIITTASRSDQ